MDTEDGDEPSVETAADSEGDTQSEIGSPVDAGISTDVAETADTARLDTDSGTETPSMRETGSEEDGAGHTDAAEATTAEVDASERGTESTVTDAEQTWGVLLHASALLGVAVPFGNVMGPLLVWLIKREESEFVDASGREAVNFQLTWTGLMLGAIVSLVVGVGFLLVPLVAIAWLALVVIGTVRASERTVYEYPMTLDIID